MSDYHEGDTGPQEPSSDGQLYQEPKVQDGDTSDGHVTESVRSNDALSQLRRLVGNVFGNIGRKRDHSSNSSILAGDASEESYQHLDLSQPFAPDIGGGSTQRIVSFERLNEKGLPFLAEFLTRFPLWESNDRLKYDMPEQYVAVVTAMDEGQGKWAQVLTKNDVLQIVSMVGDFINKIDSVLMDVKGAIEDQWICDQGAGLKAKLVEFQQMMQQETGIYVAQSTIVADNPWFGADRLQGYPDMLAGLDDEHSVDAFVNVHNRLHDETVYLQGLVEGSIPEVQGKTPQQILDSFTRFNEIVSGQCWAIHRDDRLLELDQAGGRKESVIAVISHTAEIIETLMPHLKGEFKEIMGGIYQKLHYLHDALTKAGGTGRDDRLAQQLPVLDEDTRADTKKYPTEGQPVEVKLPKNLQEGVNLINDVWQLSMYIEELSDNLYKRIPDAEHPEEIDRWIATVSAYKPKLRQGESSVAFYRDDQLDDKASALEVTSDTYKSIQELLENETLELSRQFRKKLEKLRNSVVDIVNLIKNY